MLYAFAAAAANGTFKPLYSAPAGVWPNLGGNANIVPVVANGKVYVAAYKSLMIFGPNAPAAAATASPVQASAAVLLPAGATQRVSGVLLAMEGTNLTLSTRSSQTVTLDVSHALETEQVADLIVGQAYTVLAAPGATGALQATAVMRAKRGAGAWPKDQWQTVH
jgi:hypothetical protein